jgi:hypothetical protein
MSDTLGRFCSDFDGMNYKMVEKKEKCSGMYQLVYELRDGNKLIGYFEDEYKVERFWRAKYIPSKRTEVEKWEDIWE